MIEKLARLQSINDAWMLIAATTLAALIFLPLAKPPVSSPATALS